MDSPVRYDQLAAVCVLLDRSVFGGGGDMGIMGKGGSERGSVSASEHVMMYRLPITWLNIHLTLSLRIINTPVYSLPTP